MTPPLLEARDLGFAYQAGPPALTDINLTIQPGEFVALIGQNGSGKTTLTKHFNGLLRPTQGQIRLAGEDIVGRSVSQLAQQVGYVFQNPDHQIFSPTVREELSVGPKNLRLSEPEIAARVHWALTTFGLEQYAERQPAMLGFGLRRKVSVAAVLTMQTPILVLDEPTAGLDQRGVIELMMHLQNLYQQQHTVILITHDMRLVAEYVPRCVVLHQGRCLADNVTRTIFQQTDILAQTHLDLPQITALSQRLEMVSPALTVPEFCDKYQAGYTAPTPDADQY